MALLDAEGPLASCRGKNRVLLGVGTKLPILFGKGSSILPIVLGNDKRLARVYSIFKIVEKDNLINGFFLLHNIFSSMPYL